MGFIKRNWLAIVAPGVIGVALLYVFLTPGVTLASGIAIVTSVFGQVGAVNIPVTTTDIATPGAAPSAGKTIWYSKNGTFCSLSPASVENCTGSTAGIFYQTVDSAGSGLTQQPVINFQNGITCVNNGGSSRTDCNPSTNAQIRSFGGSFDGGGVALTSGKTTYVTVPFACTIAAYNILVDTGTVSFDIWKVATGTAIPTVGNTIISGSSYLAISTGTALHSTTTSSFTTTTVAANDILGFNLQAVTSATVAQLVIQCNNAT